MKGICVFILGAATAFSADFVTGQAARLVIGQTTFTAADPNSSNSVIGAAGGVAYGGNHLFVVDDNRMGATPENNRVLIFSNLANTLPRTTDRLAQNSKCPVCVGTAAVVVGQPDFTTTTVTLVPNQANLRQPTAVASDGVRLVVADTNHNRVLIWNKIPSTNYTPADVVVGQSNFTTYTIPSGGVPTAASLRGPQGVWIQNGKLFIADSQNNRVLIFNSIPTSNGASADVVLGQPNFTTYVEQDTTQQNASAAATTLLNPVSVTSDGVHLFVSDLGYNRVLIWNSIPAKNQAAADVVIGQPDMTHGSANYAYSGAASATSGDGYVEAPVLCPVSNGTDASDQPTYPNVCNATLSFPRFALSDGTHLFVADGGNDRVLEYLTIPTKNGASADIIIGQVGGDIDEATDAADSMNTPTSLAWDGTNLYVADPYNRRILVYTPSSNPLAYQAASNIANINVYASGSITVSGSIQSGDVITIKVGSPYTVTTTYTYQITASDSLDTVLDSLVALLSAGSGDPNVRAVADHSSDKVQLFALLPGSQGDKVTYSASAAVGTTSGSSGAKITVNAAGSTLSGGGNAASVAPGTLISIVGTGLSAGTVTADSSLTQLPTTLGGTEVYINGNRAPLLYVSPTEIHAQVSWVFTDTSSVNAFVRSVMSDGSIMVTSPVALTVVEANPGLFGDTTTSNPEIGYVYHASSYATGVISIDGSVQAGDVATVTIQNREYDYTVQESDTLVSVRDGLIVLINQDPYVKASAAGPFQRIILTARLPGPDGDNITYGVTETTSSGSASVVMTALGSQLCCANVGGSVVTSSNPAAPGELVILYATGLGLPILTPTIQALLVDGLKYPSDGPVTIPQTPQATMVSAIAGGSTADVLQAKLMPGTVGTYQILLHLNSGLPSSSYTSVTIAQGVYVSNAVTFPLYNPGN